MNYFYLCKMYIKWSEQFDIATFHKYANITWDEVELFRIFLNKINKKAKKSNNLLLEYKNCKYYIDKYKKYIESKL